MRSLKRVYCRGRSAGVVVIRRLNIGMLVLHCNNFLRCTIKTRRIVTRMAAAGAATHHRTGLIRRQNFLWRRDWQIRHCVELRTQETRSSGLPMPAQDQTVRCSPAARCKKNRDDDRGFQTADKPVYLSAVMLGPVPLLSGLTRLRDIHCQPACLTLPPRPPSRGPALCGRYCCPEQVAVVAGSRTAAHAASGTASNDGPLPCQSACLYPFWPHKAQLLQ